MKRSIIVASTVGVLALGGAVAYAAIPDSGGTIHGCYSQFDGKLRVIDTASQSNCGLFEKPISWPATASGGSEVNLVVHEGTIPTGTGFPDQELFTFECPAGQEIAGAAAWVKAYEWAAENPNDPAGDERVDDLSPQPLVELTDTAATFQFFYTSGSVPEWTEPAPYKVTLKCVEE